MGKTLLRAHQIRRKPRCVLPCKRFCSCCGEGSLKPFRLESTKSSSKKKDARKRHPGFGKALKGSRRVSIHVKPSRNSRKSVSKFLQGNSSVTVLLKQVTVNITRLSPALLDVLSEKGSICLGCYSTDSTCYLSPTSESRKNSCLAAPTRRLRSTLVQPFVRQNVMDRLRGLNSDWRSTAYPLSVKLSVSSEAVDHFRGPEFTMKTLFLENLSICQKTPSDEGTKENVEISQNENRPSLLCQGQTNQLLKNTSMSLPTRSQVRFSPYQTLRSISPSASKSLSLPKRSSASPLTRYRSLLGGPIDKSRSSERLALKPRVRQNFRSLLLQDNRSQRTPELMLGKRGAAVASVPSTPLKPALRLVEPQKSKPKPKILDVRSKQIYQNKTLPADNSLIGECIPKNAPSTSRSNPTAQVERQRRSRRKQSLETISAISDISPYETKPITMVSRPDNRSLSLKSIVRTHTSANPGGRDSTNPYAGDSCSASKKHKVNPKTYLSSSPTVPSNPRCTKAASKPKQKNDFVHTIVLSDSSEDEWSTEKSAPSKPVDAKGRSAEGKRTHLPRTAHKKPTNKAAFKTIPLKSKTNGNSKSPNHNLNHSKTPASKVPERRNSLRNKNSRCLSQKTIEAIRILQDSDSRSEGVSSDSEDNAPRYLSRTGRLIGVSSSCRSCPGCKIDVPRKEKPSTKPPRKKGKPNQKLLCPDDDSIVSKCDASMGFVHGSSKKPVEKSFRQPESPPAVIIHDLISSESSSEEFIGMPNRAKVAVVVARENGASKPESSQFVDTEGANSAFDDSPAKIIPVLQRDDEVPDHLVITPESQYNLSDVDIPEMLPEDSAKAVTDDCVPGANHILQASENEVPKILEDRVIDLQQSTSNPTENPLNLDLPVEDDRIPSCVQSAANAGPPDSENSSTDKEIVDGKVAGVANLPISEVDNAPDVQCYVNHYDGAGTLALHEINCELFEEDIPHQNHKSGPQQNENDVSDPLLDSSSTSDNSSAVENFDFNEYSDCESTCSSLTCSMPEGASQGIHGVPEGRQLCDYNSDSCNVDHSSLLHESQLFSPVPEEDLPRKKAVSKAFEPSQDGPESPSRLLENIIDVKNPYSTQNNDLVSYSQHCHENLASGLPELLLPNSGIAICSHLRDSSVDIPVPGGNGELQHVYPPERSVVCNQDALRECLMPHDSSPLDATASDGKDSLYEVERSEGSSVTHEVSNNLPEPLEDSSTVLNPSSVAVLSPSQHDDTTEAVVSLRDDSSCEDGDLQNKVTPESLHSSQDNPNSQRDTKMFGTLTNLGKCNTITREMSNLKDDSQGEACRPGTTHHNNANEIMSESQDNQMFHGNHKVLEILMLEGCPSCQVKVKPENSLSPRNDNSCQDRSTRNANDCLDSRAHTEHCPRSSFSTSDASECEADSKAPEGRFYRAISNLLIHCLNNEVEVVKLVNREVIIKKVSHESAENAPEVNPIDQEASVGAKDLASIVKELNLPVSLNPRLTIKKLPYTPQKGTPFFKSNPAPQNSQVEESANQKGVSPECRQYPGNSCTTTNTPTKSINECKGYPTPIKSMDPRVLTVIKYNDLEIYNDEPSLNEPPQSDRLECISSKGIRFELNPKELADIENLLNDFQDTSIQSSAPGEIAAAPLEANDLIIYNDEPPLNVTSIKGLKCPPLLESCEDLEDLIIDNDAPPLNEPVQANTGCSPGLNDSECMVISSDDEMMTNSGTWVNSSRLEVISPPVTISDLSCEAIPKSRKKRFRKKRNALNPLRVPNIIALQGSRMKLRGEESPEFVGEDQQVLDLGELEFPRNDIDEIVIDDVGLDILPEPSFKSLPPFQSCREVLHQPQVFNHQGEPILKLDAFGHFSGHNPAIPKSSEEISSSSENVLSTSNITFDLSETFQDTPLTECLNISDSDTLTASECDDGAVVISEKTSRPTSRNALASKNACGTKGDTVVHSVDTDSDDDVILMSGPDNVRPVNTRLRNSPAPIAPSRLDSVDLGSRQRQLGVIQPHLQIPFTNLPAQLPSAQVRSVLTARGNSFYVLVVPPSSPRLRNLLVYPPISR